MVDTQKQIHRNCPLATYLPADNLLLTIESSDNADPENYLHDRKWWDHTILSVDQLGGMEYCVSVDQASMIITCITENENKRAIGHPKGLSSVWFWPDDKLFGAEDASNNARTTFAKLYSSVFQEMKMTAEELQDCGDNGSDSIYDRFSGTMRLHGEEIYDAHYPSAEIHAVKDSVTLYPFKHLSNMLLEQLTFQIVISTYVNDGNQDNLFVVRGIQVLLMHAMHAYINLVRNACVLECLSFLRRSNINIARSVMLAEAIARHSTNSASGRSGDRRLPKSSRNACIAKK